MNNRTNKFDVNSLIAYEIMDTFLLQIRKINIICFVPDTLFHSKKKGVNQDLHLKDILIKYSISFWFCSIDILTFSSQEKNKILLLTFQFRKQPTLQTCYRNDGLIRYSIKISTNNLFDEYDPGQNTFRLISLCERHYLKL